MDNDTLNRNYPVRTDADVIHEDGIQHGIDDDASNDAEKGATIGGIGGAAIGAIAGSVLGPGGALIGGLIGGAAGAVASGAAVAAIDEADNDNNVSGIGSGVTLDRTENERIYHPHPDAVIPPVPPVNPNPAMPSLGTTVGTDIPYGVVDNRGTMEKTADILTGDTVEDATGRYVGVPGDNRALDGTPDTRSLGEKAADAVTGDRYDDKTGKRIE
jgi:hypothetical protein